ncbi:MAG: hypothetical protein WCG75_12610, partial [Armatimonadota bacterium]
VVEDLESRSGDGVGGGQTHVKPVNDEAVKAGTAIMLNWDNFVAGSSNGAFDPVNIEYTYHQIDARRKPVTMTLRFLNPQRIGLCKTNPLSDEPKFVLNDIEKLHLAGFTIQFMDGTVEKKVTCSDLPLK